MQSIFQRAELILGLGYDQRLADKKVCVFGLGGVGGYVVETLVRSGIRKFILVDGDTVDITNLNRQIIATQLTVGRPKCECMRERVLSINPDCTVQTVQQFLLPDGPELENIFSQPISFVIDAVDTISLKVKIASLCEKKGIPIISAAGCGNRLNAEYKFADIYQTAYCPVCKILRKLLKEQGVRHLQVLYSPTPVIKTAVVASVPWTPSIAGIMIASKAVQDILGI